MKHQSKNVVKCKQGMNCLVTFFNEGLNCSVFLLNENLRTTKRTLARLFKRRINPLKQSERKKTKTKEKTFTLEFRRTPAQSQYGFFPGLLGQRLGFSLGPRDPKRIGRSQ